MNIPLGNVLLKPTPLDMEDIKIKLANLERNEFNGYVLAALDSAHFYVFLHHGEVRSVVEHSNGSAALTSELLFYHRLRNSECLLASYVLAPGLVDIMSKVYAFQEMHRNLPVAELSQQLLSVETQKITGMLEWERNNDSDPAYLLFNEGTAATDNYQEAYGQILTAPERVAETLDLISAQGGVVNFYGETPEQIESKAKDAAQRVNLVRELKISVDSSGFLFGGSNAVRLDEGLLREWSSGEEIQKVEVLFGKGASEIFKAVGKKGLGRKLSIPQALQKKFGLNKDDPVLVKPSG